MLMRLWIWIVLAIAAFLTKPPVPTGPQSISQQHYPAETVIKVYGNYDP